MKLAVDMTSGAWLAVERYAKQRIADLTADCVSLTASAADRDRAAYRIAELQELLTAPRRTLAITQDSVDTVRDSY